mgnify:CR=1 FL=1
MVNQTLLLIGIGTLITGLTIGQYTIPTIAGIVTAFTANYNILLTLLAIRFVIFGGFIHHVVSSGQTILLEPCVL